MPGSGRVVRELSWGSSFQQPRRGGAFPPRQLIQLTKVVGWLDDLEAAARIRGNRAAALRAKRDRSFVLLGFWCGLRSQELIQLRVEHIDIVPGRSMTCFLSTNEAGHSATITHWLPSLSPWCPVAATLAWKNAAGLTDGPLFRAINYRSIVAATALRSGNVFRSLRHILTCAGLRTSNEYVGHSLRRGFAGWADDDGWNVKALMEYVRMQGKQPMPHGDDVPHDGRNWPESDSLEVGPPFLRSQSVPCSSHI